MFLRLAVLCVRAEAISRARPMPASHADSVSTVRGRMKDEMFEFRDHVAINKKTDSIIPSRHSRAESR